MTALVVTLASVAGWLLGWFVTARWRVESWHRRGDELFKRSTEFSTRRFSRAEDRGWIAFYALVVTFVWPVALICLALSVPLFTRLDRRAEAAKRAAQRRDAELAQWRSVLDDPAASEVEKQVATEIVRALREREVKS